MKTIILAALATTMMSFENPERQRDIEQHFSTQAAERIELRGFNSSDIKIRSWDKNEVSVKLSISFSSSDQKDEQRYLDAITLKHEESRELLRITLQEPDMTSKNRGSFWSWIKKFFTGSFISKRVEGEIYVPQSNPLLAEVRYGSISLDGMKGPLELPGTGNTVVLRNCSDIREVANDYGKTTIERSGGALQLSCKSGSISIDQFDGKADIEADYSNITVRDISRSLTIHSSSGTTKVEHVGSNATIWSDYSTITANNIAGMLDIQDKSGKVRAKGVDGVRISGDYSTIEVSDVSGKSAKEIQIDGQSGLISVSDAVGNVKIDNPYGNVELRNIRGNVDVVSKSSRITGSKMTGDWRSETEYCSLSISETSARQIVMTNTGGKIELSVTTPPTSVDIKNEYADVNVDLPPGFSGEVDINVTYGHIETNLPLPRIKSFDAGGGYALGKIGNGSGKLSVETKSGNVKVIQR